MSSNQAAENPNVNAEEQMETLSEGKVAHAVERKSGTQMAPGESLSVEDFSSDIEKKKAEQAEARNEVKAARNAGVDVDGSLGEGRTNEGIRDV